MKRITITRAGYTGFEWFAELSDGTRLEQNDTCRPYALDHLVRDVARITGQTERGVRQSLRKWVS